MIVDNYEYYAALIKRIRLQHGLDDENADEGQKFTASDYVSGPIFPAKPSGANDALTLSAAHRLLGTLRDETQSRSVHDECEDVMAQLEKMVGEG